MASSRRLAAILFTDIVGFTASAQRDENGALARLREQEGMVRPLFEEFGGRWIKSTGDGSLVEFDSSIKAAQCAVEIQRKLHARNEGSAGPPLELRIGIHAGDVEERGGDIFGDAVNVAARLVPLAEPGGVVVSDQIFVHVRNKMTFPISKVGSKQLKGVQGTLDVYRIELPWAAPHAHVEESPASQAGDAAPAASLSLIDQVDQQQRQQRAQDRIAAQAERARREAEEKRKAELEVQKKAQQAEAERREKEEQARREEEARREKDRAKFQRRIDQEQWKARLEQERVRSRLELEKAKAATAAARARSASAPAPARPLPPELGSLLAMDSEERFDVEVLSNLDFPRLRSLIVQNPDLAPTIALRLEPILARVRQETTSEAALVTLVEQRVARWYRSSTTAPDWARTMPHRWGGMLASSTTRGGERRPWLLDRLLELKDQASGSGSTVTALKRLMPGQKKEDEQGRSPRAILLGRVTQALLDDLALAPREANLSRRPLGRLNELAQEADLGDILEVLGDLFPGEERDTYVLLHPNRFPDCGLVAVQPPEGRATGAALAFHLAWTAPAPPGGAGPASLTVGASPGTSSPWEPPGLKEKDWEERLATLRDKGQRVSAPPTSTYRQIGSYQELRSLLAKSETSRRAFAVAHWKGKPKGPLLLSKLWQDGSLVPETDSDSDYLEAELNDAAFGDTERAPPDGVWKVLGWRVERGRSPQGPTYRATWGASESAGPTAPAAPAPLSGGPVGQGPPATAMPASPAAGPSPSDARSALAATSLAPPPPPLPPPPPPPPPWPLEEPLCYVETDKEEELWGRIGAAGLTASQVLGFTKQNPEGVVAKFSLEGATLYRISTIEGDGSVLPTDLERIGLFIDRHLSAGPGRVVVLPGLEHLVEATNVRNVRRLLDVVRDLALPKRGSMLFSVDRSSLPAEQTAVLERLALRLVPGAFVLARPLPAPSPPPPPAGASGSPEPSAAPRSP